MKPLKIQLLSQIKSLAAAYRDEISAIRRHIHSYPELSFHEHATAAFISSRLKEWKIAHESHVAGTGIVAALNGKKGGRTIALRAELDALPIREENNVPYRSKHEGIMHACGHDAHAAALLGTAKVLKELSGTWAGRILLIFQPGEEKYPGGAQLMIRAGVLKKYKPDAILGLHVLPALDAGKMGFCSGPYMASADEIYITVKGKGGHAALAGETVNPILIASAILLELQERFMKRKRSHPRWSRFQIPTSHVLSFGKVMANGATNVIPESAEMEGTFRTFNEPFRVKAHREIKIIAGRIARKYGGRSRVKILKGYPALVNDAEVTAWARWCAEEYIGAKNVVDIKPRMTAEDFAWFARRVPACHFRLGVRNSLKGITSGVHTPAFDIDESALEYAVGVMAWIAVNTLSLQTTRKALRLSSG